MSSLVTSGLELCLPSLSMGACSEQGVRSACLGKVGTDVGGCPCEALQQCVPICAGMFGLRALDRCFPICAGMSGLELSGLSLVGLRL